MTDAIEQAIFSLRYDTGDSTAKLQAVRLAANEAAAAGEKLAVSEENISRSSLKLLAALDPRIRAEQRAADQLQRINTLYTQGAATQEQYARAVTLIERNTVQANAALEAKRSVFGRLDAGVGGLVARYASWATAIIAVQRLVHEAIRVDEEAAAAVDRLGESYSRLAKNAGPAVTLVTDLMTGLLDKTNNVVKGLRDAGAEIARSPLLGGFKGPLGAGTRQSGFSAKDATGNWSLGVFGFPEGGMTDLTAQAAAAKKLADERQKQFAQEADAIHAISQAYEALYERRRKYQDALVAAVDKAAANEIARLAQVGIAQEVQSAKNLIAIQRYWDEVDQLRQDSGEKFDEEAKRSRERQAEEAARYFKDVAADMRLIGKDFWSDFASTGRLNFTRLTEDMRQLWASVLFDMAAKGKLFGSSGMFGGGAFGGQAGQVGYVGAGLTAAALIGQIAQSPTGGTRVSGALTGAASGALMGSMILPGIGTAIGAVVGALAGALGGKDKPSNFRATATFMPGMTDFGLSGDKPNENTLGLAQQAASAIQAELSSLKAFGIEFQQQLANIWIGQRDQSTFQLVGGQRVGVGSVGNAQDLAADTLQALLKGATSSDPGINAILKSGTPDLLKALSFYQSITAALTQITDPLQAAIDLWKKESEARLAMAAATGVSIAKVEQLNSALYQQIVAQANAPALSAISGAISQLSYGPGATASPGAQYAAALTDYKKLQQAALTGGATEAQAYAQAAPGYLAQFKDYLGISGTYASLESGAIDVLGQLQTKLSATPSMPDFATPVVQATLQGAGAVVEQLQTTNERLERLESTMGRWAGSVDAMLRYSAAV